MNANDPHQLSERDLLIAIYAKLDSVGGKMDIQQSHFDNLLTKVILAVIALAAASLGLKFVGSPIIVDVAAFVTWFTGVFLLGASVAQWRQTRPVRLAFRFVLGSFMIFSGIVRSLVYHPGSQIAPWWFPPAVDGFFIALALLALFTVWRAWDDPQYTKKPHKGKKD